MPELDLDRVFTAESSSFSDLLSKEAQGCYIPAYQRPYAWDTDNVRRLLEDATFGLQKLETDENSIRFLGTLIAISGRNLVDVAPPLDQELPQTVLTIIDGQQRLCTLIVLNILLHSALRDTARALQDSEDPTLLWIKEHTDDYLEQLDKTFRFVGRRARAVDLHSYYPRIIRAFADRWARSPVTALYESPVARFIWRYVEHIESGDEETFTYDAIDDEDLEEDHEPIIAVIEFLSSAIEDLAQDGFESLKLPTGVEVATVAAYNEGLWPRAFPAHLLSYLRAAPAMPHLETVQRILRLSAFARYLNQRMAVTLVVTQAEDHAFDMFEALNTTGQPLTAFETFKPKVIEAEGLNRYANSISKNHVEEVQAYLDRFKRADDRQTASATLMIPFALIEDGAKLEKHLSAQRRYLREAYVTQPDLQAQRAFTKSLADTAQFVSQAWKPGRNRDPLLLPGKNAPRDDEAEFCLEALRDIRHDIAIAPIARFYSAYLAAPARVADRKAAAAEYHAAIKAVAAFSMMWRASQGGTGNIDTLYRTLMARGAGTCPPLCRRPRNGAPSVPTAENLKAALRQFLDDEGLDRATWIRNASHAAIYRTGNTMTRFLMFLATHDTAPDDEEPGLTTTARAGAFNMLSREKWRHEANLTVEHIAPDSTKRAGFPADVYNDQRTIHRLGNLILLPKAENGLIANRPWDQKRILYRMFSARTVRAANRAIAEAQEFGFNVSRPARELVEDSWHLPMCEAVGQYDGEWNEAFIAKRSTHLAGLAWDRMWRWLAPPAAPRARAGRRP